MLSTQHCKQRTARKSPNENTKDLFIKTGRPPNNQEAGNYMYQYTLLPAISNMMCSIPRIA